MENTKYKRHPKQIGKRITALALLGVMMFSSSLQSMATGETTTTPVELFDQSKTAKLVDWDKRTYEIDIEAAAESVLETTPLDTYGMLVLDKSSSMFDIITDENKEENPAGTLFSELNTNYIYDYGKSCGSNFSYNYLRHLIVYRNGSWQVYKQSTGDVGEWKDDILGDDNVPNKSMLHQFRFDYLREVVVNYVNGLVSTASDSKLGIIVFPSDKTMKLGLTDVSSDIVDVVLNLRSEGQGSKLGAALKEAYLQFFTESTTEGEEDIPKDDYNTAVAEGIPMYVIAVSDGRIDDEEVARQYARKLKEKNITVHTVITDFRAAQPANQELMTEIASPGCSYYTKNATDLNDIFNQIKQEYVTYEVNATVKDYIDDRFVIIKDDKQGTPVNPALNEEVDYTYAGKNAIVGRDSDGLYIKWSNQTIGEEESHWKVLIKAKDDYLGGNNVNTNLECSAIITNTQSHPLTSPQVNVKADLNVADHAFTIYKGEKVPTNEEVLNKLFDRSPDSENKGKYSVEKFVKYGIMDDVSDTDPITLKWYSDAGCTQEVTDLQDRMPESTTTYYLQVTYDAGVASETAKENTKLADGTKKYVGVESTGILTATNGDKDYGTYTIDVWELIKREKGSTTKFLPDAEFTLSQGDEVKYTGKSDANGVVTWYKGSATTEAVTDVAVGEYTLKETVAPEGYTKASGTWTAEKTATEGWKVIPDCNGKETKDGITKVYVDNQKVSSVTVNKIVKGNLGETSREFEFTATLTHNDEPISFPEGTGYTVDENVATFKLTGLEGSNSVVFKNLPVGAKLTVTETKPVVNDENEYTVTITMTGAGSSEELVATKIVGDEPSEITFTNYRNATIATGVDLDTPIRPITLLALAMVAAVIGTKVHLDNERKKHRIRR